MKVHEVEAGRRFKVTNKIGNLGNDPIYLKLVGGVGCECNVVNCHNWLAFTLNDEIEVTVEPTSDEIIHNTLMGQNFADWYNGGEFDNYISGQLPKVEKETVLQSIKKKFRNLI